MSLRTEGSTDAVADQPAPPALDPAVARFFLYRFLAAAFEIPELTSWSWLLDPDTQNAARSAAESFTIPGVESLRARAEEFIDDVRATAFEDHQAGYDSAFGHTVRGDCPMNEIEYGDIKADPLFQPHRLADLGAFYRAFGLELAEDAAERQDHICLELEFMSVLAAKEAFALESGAGEEPLAVCRDAQKKFLRDHLGRWAPAFTRRLAATAGSGTLRSLADLARSVIFADCRRFGVTPGSEDLLLRPVDEAAETLCLSCGLKNSLPGAPLSAVAVED